MNPPSVTRSPKTVLQAGDRIDQQLQDHRGEDGDGERFGDDLGTYSLVSPAMHASSVRSLAVLRYRW
jgi:hypothetical protein